MPSKSAGRKKSMDVSKPGTSAPDTSSRPLIVSGRPMVKDPMMTASDTNDTPVVEAASPETHGDRVIQPLSQQDVESDSPESETPAPEVTEVEAEAADSEQPATPDSAEEVPEEKSDEPSEETTKSSGSNETAVVDAVVDQADLGPKKKDDKETEAEKARKAEIEKLIAEETYFLPIGEITRRKNNKNSVLILLVLIVCVIGVYLLLDAEIIKSSVKLPLDLIKN